MALRTKCCEQISQSFIVRFVRYYVTPVAFLLMVCSIGRCQSGSGGEVSADFDPSAQGSAGSAFLYLSAATDFAANESSGYLIALQKVGGKKRAIAYLFVVDHSFTGNEKDEFHFHLKVENEIGEVHQEVSIGEMPLIVDYKVSVSSQHRSTSQERLTVNATPVDLKLGRVFSMDLRAGRCELKQINYLSDDGLIDKTTELPDIAELVWNQVSEQIRNGQISPAVVELSSGKKVKTKL